MSAEVNELAVIPKPVPVVSEGGQILEIINRVAMDPNADIEKMERLLVMYQSIQRDKAEREFNAALQAVQAEMPSIKRDADNKQTSSTYARLESINAALIPVYTKHGFSLSFGTKPGGESFINVTCRVSHVAGHTRDYDYPSPIVTTGIKGNAMMTPTHASGSALSYGRRYLTCLIFNVVLTNEDDDGNKASPRAEPAKIGPKRKRKIIEDMLKAVEKQDGVGLLQVVDELESDEQLAIWSELRSYERADIKKLLNEARAAAGMRPDDNIGIDLTAWSVQAINTAKDETSLKASWMAIKAAYSEAGEDVPVDVETVYTDRKAELG